jgi:hypothetical protein
MAKASTVQADFGLELELELELEHIMPRPI